MQENTAVDKRYVDFLGATLSACGEIVTQWHGKASEDGRYLNEIVAEKVNEQIANRLAAEFPNHSLFTKGSRNIGLVEYEWICDPLDGAFIYTKGLPMVVISMTLVHNGEPILTGIFQPFLKDLYIAVKDGGIWKNDQLLPRISAKLEKYAVVNAEWWPAAAYDVERVIHELSVTKELYPLHIGSVVYSACLVAEGALALSLFGGRLVGKNHEAAAVMLLMKEARGYYTDLLGSPIGFEGEMRGFIISSPEAFGDVVELLREWKVGDDEL